MSKIKVKLFMLIGPSGAGKTTLARGLARCDFKNSLTFVCSYTTRVPRQGEKEGVDYRFIDAQKFLNMLQKGFFIESSTAYNAYYGFSRESIMTPLQNGVSVLLVIDRVGARQILKEVPGAIIINIVTPNLEILRERLLKRSHISMQDFEFRLKKAEEELQEEASEKLAKHVVVNGDLELAFQSLCGIIKSELNA